MSYRLYDTSTECLKDDVDKKIDAYRTKLMYSIHHNQHWTQYAEKKCIINHFPWIFETNSGSLFMGEQNKELFASNNIQINIQLIK